MDANSQKNLEDARTETIAGLVKKVQDLRDLGEGLLQRLQEAPQQKQSVIDPGLGSETAKKRTAAETKTNGNPAPKHTSEETLETLDDAKRKTTKDTFPIEEIGNKKVPASRSAKLPTAKTKQEPVATADELDDKDPAFVALPVALQDAIRKFHAELIGWRDGMMAQLRQSRDKRVQKAQQHSEKAQQNAEMAEQDDELNRLHNEVIELMSVLEKIPGIDTAALESVRSFSWDVDRVTDPKHQRAPEKKNKNKNKEKKPPKEPGVVGKKLMEIAEDRAAERT